MSAEMLDLCFESVKPKNITKLNDIFTLSSMWLQLLQTVVKNREVLVLDRIPSLLNCYREVARTIASVGHVEQGLTPDQVQQCAGCA